MKQYPRQFLGTSLRDAIFSVNYFWGHQRTAMNSLRRFRVLAAPRRGCLQEAVTASNM